MLGQQRQPVAESQHQILITVQFFCCLNGGLHAEAGIRKVVWNVIDTECAVFGTVARTKLHLAARATLTFLRQRTKEQSGFAYGRMDFLFQVGWIGLVGWWYQRF